MSKELKRMQKLAGVPVKKKSLNEHQIGGIVGVGAINQIPPREKSDYEMAFEHFMTEGSSDMARPGTEKEAEKEEMDEGYYEEDGLKELNIGQRAKGFLDKAVQSVKNMVGKSADGKEVANALRDLGLNPNGFTGYDVIQKPNDLSPDYTLDMSTPDPKIKVKVTQHQIDEAKRMKKNIIFRASQVKINLTDNIAKFESNEFALNFENGKYEPFKKGSQPINPQELDPEKNISLEVDVDEFKKMAESPMSISIEDLRTRTGIEQKGITGTSLEEGSNIGYNAAKEALAKLKDMEDKKDFKDYVSNVDLTKIK